MKNIYLIRESVDLKGDFEVNILAAFYKFKDAEEFMKPYQEAYELSRKIESDIEDEIIIKVAPLVEKNKEVNKKLNDYRNSLIAQEPSLPYIKIIDLMVKKRAEFRDNYMYDDLYSNPEYLKIWTECRSTYHPEEIPNYKEGARYDIKTIELY